MNTRRRIALIAGVAIAALVGFSQSRPGALHSAAGKAPDAASPLPFADTPYVLGDAIERYADFMMSGGPPPDGIPAIDEPCFIDAGETDLDPCRRCWRAVPAALRPSY